MACLKFSESQLKKRLYITAFKQKSTPSWPSSQKPYHWDHAIKCIFKCFLACLETKLFHSKLKHWNVSD